MGKVISFIRGRRQGPLGKRTLGTSLQDQERTFCVLEKNPDFRGIADNAALNVSRRAVPQTEPDRLRRRTVDKTHLVKVRILGNDAEIVQTRIFPNRCVRCRCQLQSVDMSGIWEFSDDPFENAPRNILIKQQRRCHAAPSRRRSRSAANARHPRKSAVVSSGKSPMMSASLIPDAR